MRQSRSGSRADRRVGPALHALVLALVVSACTTGSPRVARPPTPFHPSPTSSTPASAARLASGRALPACVPGLPGPSQTAVFVAGGQAWASSPDGSVLTCLFEVTDPGPFIWGPRGDRALLDGLEVKGLAGAPSLPSSVLRPGPASWSRPSGESVVFVSPDGSRLKKLHLDRARVEDVTPLPRARYLSVAYHPSGLAIGFAVEQGGSQSIWISSNTGGRPRRLVFTRMGTKFGALGFSADGKDLIYEALHADGHPELHSLPLDDPTDAPVLWEGSVGQRIVDVSPGPQPESVAWTTGTGCTDARAMFLRPDGSAGRVLAGATGPTRVVGWLDQRRLLVAAGPCDGPLSLTSVDLATGVATPLVSGVEAAAVRTPAPTPPPPLPQPEPGAGTGFA